MTDTDGLCARCRKPGHCCTGFHLGAGDFAKGGTFLEALIAAATVLHDASDGQHVQLGVPFLPLHQHQNGAWMWWCPNLGRDGRCVIYEDRPGLCRDYAPGQDRLCIMHVPLAEQESQPKIPPVDWAAWADERSKPEPA
jgi:Fe-S-cluster containining protein